MILKDDLEKRAAQGRHTDTSKYPQTQQVFDKPKIDFNSHQWVQRGNMIYDECQGCVRQAVRIPYAKMLMKVDGEYTFVNEK